jgi:hypothetical protein
MLLGNVMLPTVAGHVVVMLVLLPVIAAIEAVVIARRHPLPYGRSFNLSLRANLRSTLIGIPLGYLFAFLGVIPAGMFALIPGIPKETKSLFGHILYGGMFIGGTVPSRYDSLGFFAGTILLMIPYYFITVRVEKKAIARLQANLVPARLNGTAYLMNAVTYGLLAVPVFIGGIHALLALH